MRVFIVRHGESQANVDKVFAGTLDSPLTVLGKEQATQIANRLRLEHIDVIFSSPLNRALDTAKYIALYHQSIPFKIEENLREVYFGSWEGLGWEEIEKTYGRKMNMLSPHEEYIDRSHGGESLEQRVENLIPIVENWKKKYKNKTILLSTHGYVYKAILVAFKVMEHNENLQKQRFGNTALTIIRPFDDEKIELLADVSHLES